MSRKTKRGQGRPIDVGAGEIRAQIISEAARIFAEYGYAGASIQDIVDAAGTTKPMIYYYFKNKEGLYQEILRSVHEEIHQAQAHVVRNMDATTREKLVALVDVHFQYTRRCPDHIRFMFAAHYGPRHELPKFGDSGQKGMITNAILQIVNEGMDRGALSGDPLAIAVAVLGQIMIYGALHLNPDVSFQLTDASATEVVDLLLRGAVEK